MAMAEGSLEAMKASLLTIPLEIRLHIYTYILHDNPIRHAHLAPMNSYVLDKNIEKELCTTTILSEGRSPHTTTWLRIQNTPPPVQNKLPTSILLTCKQIYTESRALPFHTSTFSFVNWFWSGVYAARQFSQGLKPWQRHEIRWINVEVLGRDLLRNGWADIGGAEESGLLKCLHGTKAEEWEDLCNLLKGLWGMKLGIKGNYGGKDGNEDSDSAEQVEMTSEGIFDTNQEWIRGLLSMDSLRWIELEIEDENTGRGEKLRFCRDLEHTLDKSRETSWGGHTKVILVEKIKHEKAETDIVWFYGEPGSDMGWS
ncbi:hypothetical protein B7494_g3541 [Chlorociboria aeruginascens]|nr:hypothetical protein B7494_g3541 [Chlorociboria aeruginascens]